MRNNLIMHFHCSECGNRLDICYEKELSEKPKDDMFENNTPTEPTGAACFYTPKISIKPCRYCIEKYTGPAKKLMESIKEINGVNNG